MCLARVEFIGEPKDATADILKEVTYLERTPAGLRVADLFGTVTELEAEIRSIDFVDSVVTVQKVGKELGKG